jgi:YycE-like N-terminal domain
MSTPIDVVGHWPEHLPVGAVRFGRASAHYDQTVHFYRDLVGFYRDLVGLPVLETFEGSYGEDGTIFGLPDTSLHLEIVRSTGPAIPLDRIDMLVFYLPDSAAREASGRQDGSRRQGACFAAPLLAGEWGRDLPRSGWAGGRVRVVELRGEPDLTALFVKRACEHARPTASTPDAPSMAAATPAHAGSKAEAARRRSSIRDR